ncbi:MAG: glycosyltransferase family 4 protein [Alphaproteobacteria bacterium]
MNILLSAPQLDASGAPSALLRLARGLAPRHSMTLVLRPGADATLAPQFREIGVPVVASAAVPGRFDAALVNTLVQSRAVHTIGPRLPTLWWVHEPRNGLELIALRPEVAGGFAIARHLVFPARWQAECLYRPWLGETPWSVVPVGLAFDPTPMPPPFERARGKFVLLQVGSLVRRKGADTTLAALSLLDDPKVHVVFIGAPVERGYLGELRRIVRADPRLGRRTTFVGGIDDRRVAAYLQHADGLVMPTRDDLFPMAVAEALAAGLPVVASDLPPIREAMADGAHGLLVPPDDPPALAAAIARLRDDPPLRARLGAAGRRLAEERFALDRFVAAMEDVLTRTAGGRSAGNAAAT